MVTLEDLARLRPLLENAIAEAQHAMESGSMVKPDRPHELQESLDWGRGFLKRIEEVPETLRRVESKPVGVWILWGLMPDPGTVPSRYEFETQAELDAFLLGVDESSGWMEYTVKDDATPHPDPPEEPEDEDEGLPG